MKKRVCPICDNVMKTSHFCPNCKLWIKTPCVMEVDYYLNESHPRKEVDCEYHNPSFDREEGIPTNPKRAEVKKIAGWQTVRREPGERTSERQGRPAGHSHQSQSTQMERQLKKKEGSISSGNRNGTDVAKTVGRVLKAVVFIYILFSVVMPYLFEILLRGM